MLATPDEFAGSRARPSARMLARVNGKEHSRGNLDTLHEGFDDMLVHVGRDSRLVTGDVVASGTVATGCILEMQTLHGADRYPWLRSGDVVELEVDRFGILQNRIA